MRVVTISILNHRVSQSSRAYAVLQGGPFLVRCLKPDDGYVLARAESGGGVHAKPQERLKRYFLFASLIKPHHAVHYALKKLEHSTYPNFGICSNLKLMDYQCLFLQDQENYLQHHRSARDKFSPEPCPYVVFQHSSVRFSRTKIVEIAEMLMFHTGHQSGYLPS
jgi:hypothetical protein